MIKYRSASLAPTPKITSQT